MSVYTLREAAELLGVSVSALRARVRSGDLQPAQYRGANGQVLLSEEQTSKARDIINPRGRRRPPEAPRSAGRGAGEQGAALVLIRRELVHEQRRADRAEAEAERLQQLADREHEERLLERARLEEVRDRLERAERERAAAVAALRSVSVIDVLLGRNRR